MACIVLEITNNMKFSILTACHNAAPFIKTCVDSVLSQSYSDFEWVIVDDMSSDGSYSAFSEISDPRIVLVKSNKRLFCSGSYRLALSRASGDICGVLDADDALHPEALLQVIQKYEQYPNLGYIYTQHFWCDANLKVIRNGLSSKPPFSSLVDSAKKTRSHCFSHFRTFRRHLASLTEIFPKNLMVAVDKNMGYALEEVAFGGFYPVPLYYYRYHKSNMSKTQSGNQKATWLSMTRDRSNHRRRFGIRTFSIVEIQ